MPGPLLLSSSVGLLLSKLESFLVLFLLLVLLVTIFMIGSWELQRALGSLWVYTLTAHTMCQQGSFIHSQLLAKMESGLSFQGLSICEFSRKKVTINYLFGNLGKTYSETVGVVDLGGGSVQMAYAISESDAAKAPKVSGYVQQMYLKGRKCHFYDPSYLQYGLLAARAEILKFNEEFGGPCILTGYNGEFVKRSRSEEAETLIEAENLKDTEIDGDSRVCATTKLSVTLSND